MSSELLDQPLVTRDPTKVFILSSPRSGSYMLCRYMINAGLGVPHEYFNPIIMRQISPRLGLGNRTKALEWRRRTPRDRLPFGKAARAREADFLRDYIGILIPRRCQAGVFAAKIHFEQYLKVLDNPVGWKLLDGSVFVHLYREDLLRQAVSMYFSKLTGRWGIDGAITTAPAQRPNFFDLAAIDRTLEYLAEEDRGWRMFLSRNGVSPMSISYEELCKAPFEFVTAVARRLGIDPGTLRQGYSEAGAPPGDDPSPPSKSDVLRHYLDSVRKLSGYAPAPSRNRVPADMRGARY